jgi:hypothetical protein
MLLRFVKSCLRGEAALWWEGCISTYGDEENQQGPSENYAAFKIAFKQHYGMSSGEPLFFQGVGYVLELLAFLSYLKKKTNRNWERLILYVETGLDSASAIAA